MKIKHIIIYEMPYHPNEYERRKKEELNDLVNQQIFK